MKLHCPHCGVNGTADDSYAGKKLRCPKCQGMFVADPETSADEMGIAPAEATPLVSESPMEETPVRTEADQEVEADDGVSTEPDLPLPEEDQPEEAIDLSDVVAKPEQDDTTVTVPDGFVTESPAALADFAEEDVPPASVEAEDVDTAEVLEEAILAEDDTVMGDAEPIEDRPYGLDGQQCWQCGKNDSGEEPFIAKEGRLYCSECLEKEDQQEAESVAEEAVPPAYDDTAAEPNPSYGFTVFGAIKEAWQKTKGVKGSIWMGSAIMYLVMLVLVAGGAWLLPAFDPNMPDVTSLAGNIIFQVAVNAISLVFTAGLLVVGIRHVAGKPISWKMVFDGFPLVGRIVVVSILQFILIGIGFLLLVLPGIYLSVGYALAIPLIVDQQLSPWQALERSRKAIHKVWWKVAGLCLVMGIIMAISMIPLGIGLIWTWPMFIVLAGVLYRYLFGRGHLAG